MTIKILGSGCKSCITLADNTKEALKEMGLDVQIGKVTDFSEIASYGVMSTPALVVDEKVVSFGKVLKSAEIKKLLEKNYVTGGVYMSERISKCDCGTNNNCCSPKPKRQVVIDFLYLDLNTCDRCCDTEKTLSDALSSVKDVLNSAGIEAKINKYLIDTKEKAVKNKLLSSPTIRINGIDIDVDVKESECQSCGDVCGDNVDCRVWSYQGIEYNSPPKALIVDAILREVYAPESIVQNSDYIMPANLERFFDALSRKRGVDYAGK